MTAEEVKKVKRTLKKYGFKQHRILKEFHIKVYNDCSITVSFREPMIDMHFMSVVIELDDDYELALNSILDYAETNPQRFFDTVDHFNAAIKFINR